MEYFVGLIGLLSIIGIPYLASKRGRNPFLFFVLTLFIGPLALIFLRTQKESSEQSMPSEFENMTEDESVNVSFSFGNDDYVAPTDARVAECPTCGLQLKKIPGSKTKCPKCAAFMYVRTDPTTNTRLVVTEKRAEEIDDEWAKINGTWEDRENEKRRYMETKERLTTTFNGAIPSDYDIKWSLLNEDSIQHSSMQNWGLYRNTIFQMGELLRKEEKHLMSIEKYLLVCYIDTCGPNNISTPLGQKNEYGQKAFSKDEAFLAPGILERIIKAARKIDKDLDELKEIFLRMAESYKGSIPFTLTPEKSWLEIIAELKKQ